MPHVHSYQNRYLSNCFFQAILGSLRNWERSIGVENKAEQKRAKLALEEGVREYLFGQFFTYQLRYNLDGILEITHRYLELP